MVRFPVLRLEKRTRSYDVALGEHYRPIIALRDVDRCVRSVPLKHINPPTAIWKQDNTLPSDSIAISTIPDRAAVRVKYRRGPVVSLRKVINWHCVDQPKEYEGKSCKASQGNGELHDKMSWLVRSRLVRIR